MNTVRLVLPTALLLYFLWRSRRQRVFLLGLPFLMNMYFSVFFDSLKPNWVPSAWQPADHMMLWLVVTWIVYFDLVLPWRRRTVRERRVFGPRLSAPEEVVLVGFMAYALFKVGTTAVHHMDLGTAIGEARIPLYMFAGYLLLRGILCHAARKETVDLLAAVVVVNSVAAGLYVLHQGLHLYIYAGMVEYQYIVVNGEILTRSFYFMPQYLPLAVGLCVARRKWNLFWVGVFAVNLAAIWLSYTRALIGVVVVEIAVILAMRLLKQGDVWRAVKRGLQIAVILVVFVGTAFVLLPTQSAYLMSRLTETTSQGSARTDSNLEYRFIWWRTTIEWLGGENRLSGVGFPSSAQDVRVTDIAVMAPDIMWVPVLWSMGLLGVAGLAGLFAVILWRAASLSLTSGGDAALLSTALTGWILAVVLLGLREWVIYDPWHTPLALSFFALLTAETQRQRTEARQRTVVVSDDRVAIVGVRPESFRQEEGRSP